MIQRRVVAFGDINFTHTTEQNRINLAELCSNKTGKKEKEIDLPPALFLTPGPTASGRSVFSFCFSSFLGTCNWAESLKAAGIARA